jgi:hypothetical protein
LAVVHGSFHRLIGKSMRESAGQRPPGGFQLRQ